MSVSRLATMTMAATSRKMPSRMGASRFWTALSSSLPMPGQPKTISTSTAPESRCPVRPPMIVATGSKARRRAWCEITRRSATPFARAVRT